MNGDGRKYFNGDFTKLLLAALLSSSLSIGGYKVVTPHAGLSGDNAIDVAVMNERVRSNRELIDSNYDKLCTELNALNKKVEQMTKTLIELQVLIKEQHNESDALSKSSVRQRGDVWRTN